MTIQLLRPNIRKPTGKAAIILRKAGIRLNRKFLLDHNIKLDEKIFGIFAFDPEQGLLYIRLIRTPNELTFSGVLNQNGLQFAIKSMFNHYAKFDWEKAFGVYTDYKTNVEVPVMGTTEAYQIKLISGNKFLLYSY